MAYIFISPIFTLVLLRRAHWLNMTCGYHYKRVYRPGRINVADPISRAPQHHVHRAATLAAVRLATTLRSHRPCTLATCPQNVEYRAAVPEPGHSMLTPLSLSLSTTVGSDSLLLHCWDAGGAGRPVDEIARSAISVGGSDAPICDLADDAMEHWLQPLVPLCVARTRRSSSPCAEPVGEAQDPVSYCRKTFFDRLKASFKAQTLASADVLAWSLRKGEDGVYQTESDQLYVPDYDNLRRECFELVHSDALSGHFGIARTIVKARRHFFWPSLSKGIKDWVTSCDSCQRVKALRQKPYGKLQPLQIPGRRWESISMDLITNLPVTPQGHEHLGRGGQVIQNGALGAHNGNLYR